MEAVLSPSRKANNSQRKSSVRKSPRRSPRIRALQHRDLSHDESGISTEASLTDALSPANQGNERRTTASPQDFVRMMQALQEEEEEAAAAAGAGEATQVVPLEDAETADVAAVSRLAGQVGPRHRMQTPRKGILASARKSQRRASTAVRVVSAPRDEAAVARRVGWQSPQMAEYKVGTAPGASITPLGKGSLSRLSDSDLQDSAAEAEDDDTRANDEALGDWSDEERQVDTGANDSSSSHRRRSFGSSRGKPSPMPDMTNVSDASNDADAVDEEEVEEAGNEAGADVDADADESMEQSDDEGSDGEEDEGEEEDSVMETSANPTENVAQAAEANEAEEEAEQEVALGAAPSAAASAAEEDDEAEQEEDRTVQLGSMTALLRDEVQALDAEIQQQHQHHQPAGVEEGEASECDEEEEEEGGAVSGMDMEEEFGADASAIETEHTVPMGSLTALLRDEVEAAEAAAQDETLNTLPGSGATAATDSEAEGGDEQVGASNDTSEQEVVLSASTPSSRRASSGSGRRSSAGSARSAATPETPGQLAEPETAQQEQELERAEAGSGEEEADQDGGADEEDEEGEDEEQRELEAEEERLLLECGVTPSRRRPSTGTPKSGRSRSGSKSEKRQLSFGSAGSVQAAALGPPVAGTPPVAAASATAAASTGSAAAAPAHLATPEEQIASSKKPVRRAAPMGAAVAQLDEPEPNQGLADRSSAKRRCTPARASSSKALSPKSFAGTPVPMAAFSPAPKSQRRTPAQRAAAVAAAAATHAAASGIAAAAREAATPVEASTPAGASLPTQPAQEATLDSLIVASGASLPELGMTLDAAGTAATVAAGLRATESHAGRMCAAATAAYESGGPFQSAETLAAALSAHLCVLPEHNANKWAAATLAPQAAEATEDVARMAATSPTPGLRAILQQAQLASQRASEADQATLGSSRGAAAQAAAREAQDYLERFATLATSLRSSCKADWLPWRAKLTQGFVDELRRRLASVRAESQRVAAAAAATRQAVSAAQAARTAAEQSHASRQGLEARVQELQRLRAAVAAAKERTVAARAAKDELEGRRAQAAARLEHLRRHCRELEQEAERKAEESAPLPPALASAGSASPVGAAAAAGDSVAAVGRSGAAAAAARRELLAATDSAAVRYAAQAMLLPWRVSQLRAGDRSAASRQAGAPTFRLTCGDEASGAAVVLVVPEVAAGQTPAVQIVACSPRPEEGPSAPAAACSGATQDLRSALPAGTYTTLPALGRTLSSTAAAIHNASTMDRSIAHVCKHFSASVSGVEDPAAVPSITVQVAQRKLRRRFLVTMPLAALATAARSPDQLAAAIKVEVPIGRVDESVVRATVQAAAADAGRTGMDVLATVARRINRLKQ